MIKVPPPSIFERLDSPPEFILKIPVSGRFYGHYISEKTGKNIGKH